MMKLYYDPASTVCRPIAMFLLEHPLDVELVPVQLQLGEHLSDAFRAINPNRQVPALVDAIFTLADEPSEDAVEIYISRLRKKLDGSSAAIVTLRGLGYLLRKKEDDQ